MNKLLVPATALFWLLAAPAAAQEIESPDAAADEAEQAPVPHRLGTEFGMRLLVVDDPSLDPYTASNVVPQAMLALTYTPLSIGPAAFGVVTEYDFGRIGGDIRGIKTSLAMHRFAGGLQAEIELWRFQLYARGMAGALHALGTIGDTSAGAELEAANWTWVADASGGVRFRLGSAGPEDDPAISFWLLAEGGYSFAGDMAMAFAPALEDDDPRQVGAVELPPLHPAGGTARFAFTLSFL